MLLRKLPYSALSLDETAKCFRGLLLCYKPKYDIVRRTKALMN